MFNDRSGFRNSCATRWKPWSEIEERPYSISSSTSVLMDSHVYDYLEFSEKQRLAYLMFWVEECYEVYGSAFLLWHPQTITQDYGWSDGFEALVERCFTKKNEKILS